MSLPGMIKEGRTVQVSFKTGGQISSLKVKEGDYVGSGQLIATLDAADYRIALDASKAQYVQMKNEAARIQTLYERGSVSKNEYEKAVAGLEQITADMRAKTNQLAYASLHSPAEGYVRSVDAHAGEFVGAGTAVVTLLDVGRMEVEVGLPYHIYQRRGELTNFTAIVDGKAYPLTKLNIIPKAGSTQQYTLLLVLPADKALKETSGLNVEVRFTMAGHDETSSGVTIPESSIVYDGSRPGVWVLKQDSTVTRRQIETGTVTDGRVNVLKGLDGSETIVKAGAGTLHEGEKVSVLQPKSATNPGGVL